MDDLTALRSEPLSYVEHQMLLDELKILNILNGRANEIAGSTGNTLEIGLDLAKAERLIIESGYDIDIIRYVEEGEGYVDGT